MSSDLSAIRAALVTALDTALDANVEGWGVGSAFDDEGMKRFISKAPIALVALTSASDFTKTGNGWQATVGFTVFLVTRDAVGLPRDEKALTLATKIMGVVYDLAFGTTGSFRVLPPANMQADNLYSGDVNKVAVAVWAVSWEAPVIAS